MNTIEMETLLINIDARTTRIEQILPTLATKEELQAAIAPLATRDEMDAAIGAAVAPLATKEDLRAGLEEARRHAIMLNEDVRDDIRLLAEHLAGLLGQKPRE